MAPLSVLDLYPIVQGSDAAQSPRNTLELARHSERWGYRRSPNTTIVPVLPAPRRP